VSERYACRIVSQPRGTQRYVPTVRADECVLIKAVVTHASEYGHYRCHWNSALPPPSGYEVGNDCVRRIWHRECLKGSKKLQY